MQETIEITTPLLSKKVVLKGYMTGRDELAIKAIIESGMDVSFDQTGIAQGKMNVGVQSQANRKALEIMVNSVDGNTENVVDQVLDMPAQDFNFVQDKVNELTSGMSDEKKADSSDNPISSPPVDSPA